jgi:hypothetical protein
MGMYGVRTREVCGQGRHRRSASSLLKGIEASSDMGEQNVTWLFPRHGLRGTLDGTIERNTFDCIVMHSSRIPERRTRVDRGRILTKAIQMSNRQKLSFHKIVAFHLTTTGACISTQFADKMIELEHADAIQSARDSMHTTRDETKCIS